MTTADDVDAAVIGASIEHNAVVLPAGPQDLAKLTSAAEHLGRILFPLRSQATHLAGKDDQSARTQRETPDGCWVRHLSRAFGYRSGLGEQPIDFLIADAKQGADREEVAALRLRDDAIRPRRLSKLPDVAGMQFLRRRAPTTPLAARAATRTA